MKDIFYSEFLRSPDDRILMPEIAHLSRNFRTHMGVVSLANSVVQLIERFFPESIDKLPPESSTVTGPLPILLECENVVVTLFQNGELTSCEFGAEQVNQIAGLY